MTAQEYAIAETEKAAQEMADALLRLPEDKRNWSPGEQNRSALDQVAECAVLTGKAAQVLASRKWVASWMDDYYREKAEAVAKGSDPVLEMLAEGTKQFIAALREVPDADMDTNITLPWGERPLRILVAYPSWNMTYHLGQINFVAMMLGVL